MKTILAILVCLLALSAHSTTYYVNSSTGDDSRTTTQAQSAATPWLTLYTSINKLSPGDTLTATGTFSESPGWGSYRTVTASGSAGSPITVLASNATININDNCSDSAGIYRFNGDYLTLDGFGLTSTMPTGVYYGGFFGFFGNHCMVKNLVVTNAYGSHDTNAGNGDHLWCFVVGGSQNTFSNIFFHEINDADLFRLGGATNNLFSHLVISNCLNPYYDFGGGTMLHADFMQTGEYTGDADTRSNAVECCLFINHDSDRTNASISGGIYSSSGTTNPVWWSHWSFRNNVFVNWGQWFECYNYTNHFYNNLFFNCGAATYNHIITCSDAGGEGIGSDLQNNVFIASGVESWPTISVSYNAGDSASFGYVYNPSGWSPSVGNITNSIAEMAFVNATNYPYDFHLRSGSVLIGAAANLTDNHSASTTDMDGNARPLTGPWTIGAYEGISTNTPTILTNGIFTIPILKVGEIKY